ncbi:MAG: hypothetical protein IH945_03550 [Armatimonadetes bacterium]|nr:hypothetical protein [Armatimonadota bacterium]
MIDERTLLHGQGDDELNAGPQCNKCGNAGNRCHCHDLQICEECRQEDCDCGADDQPREGKEDQPCQPY